MRGSQPQSVCRLAASRGQTQKNEKIKKYFWDRVRKAVFHGYIVESLLIPTIFHTRKEDIMKPIRDPEGRFVLAVDEKKRIVERLEKGWITRVEFKDDGTVSVTHFKKLKSK
jgi:hypothetical protein